MGRSRLARERLVGLAWIIASAAGFGAMAILAKIAYASGADLPTLLFLRFAMAGGLLWLWTWRSPLAWPHGSDLATLVAMGAIGYVGQAYCFFAALRHASAGVVALLLYLYPALVTLFSALLLRQRIDGGRWLAVSTALVGTAFVVSGDLASTPLGIAYGLGAALIYSLYILAGARLMPRVGALSASRVVIPAAACVYAVVMMATGPAWPQGIAGWLATGGIALFSTLLAVLGFFKGLERLGPTDAATLSTLEPLITLGLAAVFLGETFTPGQLFGGALVLATVIYLARRG